MRGYFCPGQVLNKQPCPRGRYGDIPNAPNKEEGCPKFCPAGRYGISSGNATIEAACSLPNSCEEGCFCPKGSDKPCPHECPAGRYSDESGMINEKDGCKDCNPGKYCPGKNKVTLCTAGRFGYVYNETKIGAACPGLCPIGKYGIGPGHQFEYSACKVCDAGRYPNYSAEEGRTKKEDACIECAVGTYKQYNDIALCTLCPLGFYGDLGNNPNITTPSESTKKTGKKTFSTACTKKCPPGKHGKSLGQYNVDTGCEDCEPGKYNKNHSQPTCRFCSKGKYSKNVTGSTTEDQACEATCEMGFYCPGLGEKHSCPAGRFGYQENQMEMEKACLMCNTAVSFNFIFASHGSLSRKILTHILIHFFFLCTTYSITAQVQKLLQAIQLKLDITLVR